MVDEPKKDVKVEQPAKPKPIEEKIPEKILKLIEGLRIKKGQLVNQFLNVSFQLGEIQEAQNTIRNQVKNTSNSIKQKIQYAYEKLKLKKKKNYRWQYNGKDGFVGNLIPESKKPEQK